MIHTEKSELKEKLSHVNGHFSLWGCLWENDLWQHQLWKEALRLGSKCEKGGISADKGSPRA